MPPTSKLSVRICLFLSKITAQAAAAWVAVAAGLCSEEEIRRLTRLYWDQDDEEASQSEAQADSGLMDWEAPMLAGLPKSGTVGIIGCGAGREMIALLKLGYAVDGIDVAPKPVERARKHLQRAGLTGNVVCADITDAAFPRPAYDVFWFGWFSYSYIVGTHRRIETLRRLLQQLNPGGSVLLTFIPWKGEGRRSAALAHWVGRLSGNPRPPVRGDCFTSRLSYEHRFTEAEIINEAEASGFRVVYCRLDSVGLAVLSPRKFRNVPSGEDSPARP